MTRTRRGKRRLSSAQKIGSKDTAIIRFRIIEFPLDKPVPYMVWIADRWWTLKSGGMKQQTLIATYRNM